MNEDNFNAEINSMDWSSVLPSRDPSDAWDKFVVIYNRLLDSNLPVWITREFLAMCKLRDNVKKKFKKQGSKLIRERQIE